MMARRVFFPPGQPVLPGKRRQGLVLLKIAFHAGGRTLAIHLNNQRLAVARTAINS
jgi:hypothetical protein